MRREAPRRAAAPFFGRLKIEGRRHFHDVTGLDASAPSLCQTQSAQWRAWRKIQIRRHLGVIKGRMRRLQYFYWKLGILVVFFVVLLAVVKAVPDLGSRIRELGTMWLLPIEMLIDFLLFLTISVKTFHDFGRSGWYYLLAIIPVVNVVLTLFLLFTPGTPGENKYGINPRRNPEEAPAE